MIRVLIVDDHAVVREGVRLLLEAEPDMEVVGEAADGEEAIRQTLALDPDVVLLDIGLPGMSGFEVTRRLRDQASRSKILALTMHSGEEYVLNMLRAGAAGYVLKQAPGAEVTGAIRTVAAGEAFLYPTVTKTLLDDYLAKMAGEEGSGHDGLTDREREVLKLVAEGHTNAEIAELLCISLKTVQTHRANLMRKLGMHDRTELVKYALRRGLVQIDLPPDEEMA